VVGEGDERLAAVDCGLWATIGTPFIPAWQLESKRVGWEWGCLGEWRAVRWHAMRWIEHSAP